MYMYLALNIRLALYPVKEFTGNYHKRLEQPAIMYTSFPYGHRVQQSKEKYNRQKHQSCCIQKQLLVTGRQPQGDQIHSTNVVCNGGK